MKNRITTCLGVTFCSLLFTGCGSDLPPIAKADPNKVQDLRTKFASLAKSDDGDEAQVAGPTGYATAFKGRFVLSGDVPQKSISNVTKDQQICAPGGGTVYANDIEVDPGTKGIANVVIFADAVPPDWLHESAKTPAEEEVVFDQKACIFLQRVVAMQTSQKLKALNSDPVGHNLNVKNFNKTIEPGKFLYFEPEKQDKVPAKMSCSIHPWMTAYFLGRDDGYFAVTKADGSFEIPNLPAGVKLTFRVWHERAGSINGQISVNGVGEKWKKGKFTRTLEPDSVSELDVVLESSMF